MPVALPPSKVLVIGASGFSGVWVVKTLLEKGYVVRGTVRSEAKGKYLEEYFKSHPGKFEFVLVPNVGALSQCWGPVIHQYEEFEMLNLSVKLCYDMLTTPRTKGTTNDYAADWIDVREVATAVSVALASDKVAGERFILDTGSATYQNIYDSLRVDPAIRSTLPSVELIQAGEPVQPPQVLDFSFASSARAQKVLGLNKPYPLGLTVAETWRTIHENGKLPAAKLQRSIATFGFGTSEKDKEEEAAAA
ncbi:hypothetical protein DENSPDRAFT_873798 [Dentipellis sp. KUC8613]|nr:hypothetical protein DENSPDRAFT_873798 [Dentipellis sp. KUC8613]